MMKDTAVLDDARKLRAHFLKDYQANLSNTDVNASLKDVRYQYKQIQSWKNDKTITQEVQSLLDEILQDYGLIMIYLDQKDKLLLSKDINADTILPFLADQRRRISDNIKLLGAKDDLSQATTIKNAIAAFATCAFTLLTCWSFSWVFVLCELEEIYKDKGSCFLFYTHAPKQTAQKALFALDQQIKDDHGFQFYNQLLQQKPLAKESTVGCEEKQTLGQEDPPAHTRLKN